MNKDELFKQVKLDHSDWSDEQIWTQVSVLISAGEPISKEGRDVSITEDLLRLILEKAKDWLLNELPAVFEKVVDFFDDLIDRLPTWAKKGLPYVFKLIKVIVISTLGPDDNSI